jgi:hypothetical protein
MPCGETAKTSSNESIERAVDQDDAVDIFLPCRVPKENFSKERTSMMSSNAQLRCEIPGTLLSPCARCSGFCLGDVFLHNDNVFCSEACRDEGKKSRCRESHSAGKLRRRPSNLF